MAAKKIITAPNKILRLVSEPVDLIDSTITSLVEDMADTIESYSSEHEAGVALAAIQIGVPKRVVVIKENDDFIALINPCVTKESKAKEEDLEGCMSIPQKYAFILRPNKIKIKAKNLEGEDIKISAEGMMARIILHEIDHLQGRLLTDFVDDSKLYTLDSKGKLVKEISEK
jgi:peptide deformylase